MRIKLSSLITFCIILIFILVGCTKQGKIENLKKEADQLESQGKILEATEVYKEINAIERGEKYKRDTNPELTKENEYKDNFSYLKISNTSVTYSNIVDIGELNGKITNTSNKILSGYFDAIFYSSGDIVKTYTTHIPGLEIAPGQTKVFSIPINKFRYDKYEFQGDIITEK